MPNSKIGHGMNEDVIYGPVYSRRYGLTLGINLLPSHFKQCSFNCVYCQLGWNSFDVKVHPTDFPVVEKIRKQLQNSFHDLKKSGVTCLDHLVISGNGEPTLYPDFPKAIKVLQEVKNEVLPLLPLVCLTNGAHLHEEQIFNAMQVVDECAVKFDANASRINIPKNEFEKDRLINLIPKIKNAMIQSCFVTGSVSNVDDQSIEEWLNFVIKARPTRLDLYTISRNTAAKKLLPVAPKILSKIADQIRRQVSFPVFTYT